MLGFELIFLEFMGFMPCRGELSFGERGKFTYTVYIYCFCYYEDKSFRNSLQFTFL